MTCSWVFVNVVWLFVASNGNDNLFYKVSVCDNTDNRGTITPRCICIIFYFIFMMINLFIDCHHIRLVDTGATINDLEVYCHSSPSLKTDW